MSASSSLPSSSIPSNDAKKLFRNLKLAQAKVRNTLDVFSPSKYSPEVVKAKEDLWIKKVEDAFDVIIELSLDLEEFISPAEAHEIFMFNESLKTEISKFVFSIHTIALSKDLHYPVKTSFEIEIQPKVDRHQFPTFSGNNENQMNVLRANQVQEEVDAEQSQKCLESEPRESIPNPIKIINDVSSAEIIQTQVECLADVQSVLQDMFKLVSVDQKFRRHVLNYVMLRSVMLQFPIQEMHVMLQMSSGSIQRLYSILDYIQLPLSRSQETICTKPRYI